MLYCISIQNTKNKIKQTIPNVLSLKVNLLLLLSFLVFFFPNLLGHSDNYIPANPLITPPHIVPEWYFLPFYAILRSIPDKLGGVIAMISAILVLMLLPSLNNSNVRSTAFRPIFSIFF